MAAGGWFDWSTGDVVTEARFGYSRFNSLYFASEKQLQTLLLTNKVEGTVFYDTGANLLKAWSGSAWIGAEAGDIEGVTAGTNLNGGGTSGTVTVNLDSTVSSIAFKIIQKLM